MFHTFSLTQIDSATTKVVAQTDRPLKCVFNKRVSSLLVPVVIGSDLSQIALCPCPCPRCPLLSPRWLVQIIMGSVQQSTAQSAQSSQPPGSCCCCCCCCACSLIPGLEIPVVAATTTRASKCIIIIIIGVDQNTTSLILIHIQQTSLRGGR